MRESNVSLEASTTRTLLRFLVHTQPTSDITWKIVRYAYAAMWTLSPFFLLSFQSPYYLPSHPTLYLVILFFAKSLYFLFT